MKDAQKSRVTLDHPDLGGRVRHSNAEQRPRQQRRMVGGTTDSMLVQRAQLARRAQATRREISSNKILEARAEHQSVAQAQIVEAQTEYVQSSTEASAPQKNKLNFNTKSFKTNAVYAMAALLFIVGMGVAIDGYLSNNKTKEQIAVLGEAVKSAEQGEITELARSLPNEDEVNDFDISQYVVAPDAPRYFRAPTIGVNTTRVLVTGLTANGEVDTPAGIYDTSWFNSSAKITDEKGAMFVVGHYVGPTEAGIFWKLDDLNPGDEVEIEQGDGTINKFRVVDKSEYHIDNVDMAKALTPVNTDKLGLNLMTCGGDWDVASQLYDKRILIRAEKI